MDHVTVYHKDGRYCGWPANHGMWAWGDELVVGFTLGYHARTADGELLEAGAGGLHVIDRHRAPVTMQARSRDGGETWQVRGIPASTPGDRALSADEHIHPDQVEELRVGGALEQVNRPTQHPGGVNFDHPDFALMAARTGIGSHFRARSWWYFSYDRCRHWNGPYALPDLDHEHMMARTDYVPVDDRECFLFVSVMDGPPLHDRSGPVTSDIQESSVRCLRSEDWAGRFDPVGTVTDGAIMPASVRLDDGRLLSAVRRSDRIDLFESTDDGRTWTLLATPVDAMGGNPPTLTALADDTLCITYGHRMPEDPGIRATLSTDGGETWHEPITLRGQAGSRDLGYPRTVQRADGKLVTVYYVHDEPGSERYIAATIWDPADVA